MALALAFVIAAPVSIWRARRGARERQRLHFAAWLGASAMTLWWIDTGMHWIALTDLREIERFTYAPVAAALTVVLLAVAPYGGRDALRTLGGLAALWALCVLLPPGGWNDEKRAILDASAVLDQPLASVKERLGRYYGSLYDDAGAEIAVGTIAELDLEALRPAELQLDPIGGLWITVEDGIVRSVGFNYD